MIHSQWNSSTRSQKGLKFKSVHEKHISHMQFHRFLWLFCIVSNPEQLQSCIYSFFPALSSLGTQILPTQRSGFLFLFSANTFWASTPLSLFRLAGPVARRVNTHTKSHTLNHWRTFSRWFLAPANVCMLVCVFVCCNYSKNQKYVTGPDECLHFLFFTSHFGGSEIGWMKENFILFCICCACILNSSHNIVKMFMFRVSLVYCSCFFYG